MLSKPAPGLWERPKRATRTAIYEELKKHPELLKDSDAALKLITDSVVKRLSGPWGRLLLGRNKP